MSDKSELAARWREAKTTGEYGWVALWVAAERKASGAAPPEPDPILALEEREAA